MNEKRVDRQDIMSTDQPDWHKLLVYYIDHVIAHESVSYIESTSIGTMLMYELSEEEMVALRQAETEARNLNYDGYWSRVSAQARTRNSEKDPKQ
jgi:hypothetical protein